MTEPATAAAPRPADLHVHPDWSIDGSGTMRAYCLRAVELALPAVCFAPHFYLIPENFDRFGFVKRRGEKVCVRDAWAEEYRAEAAALSDEFAGRLRVLAGVEVDYAPGVEAELDRFLDRHPMDFVVGAVHSVHGLDIMIPEEMDRLVVERGKAGFLATYFDLLERMAAWGRCGTVAHLFGHLRCDRDRFSPPEDLPEGALDRLFGTMARTGVSLEVSSALLRQNGWGINPSPPVLDRARAAGVATYTFASDAHRVEDLGWGIDRAAETARAAGLAERPLPARGGAA